MTPVVGYRAVVGVDWPGFVLAVKAAKTLSACVSLCDASSACVAFVWDVSEGTCSLRSDEGDASESDETTTYLRQARNPVYYYSDVEVSVTMWETIWPPTPLNYHRVRHSMSGRERLRGFRDGSRREHGDLLAQASVRGSQHQ